MMTDFNSQKFTFLDIPTVFTAIVKLNSITGKTSKALDNILQIQKNIFKKRVKEIDDYRNKIALFESYVTSRLNRNLPLLPNIALAKATVDIVISLDVKTRVDKFSNNRLDALLLKFNSMHPLLCCRGANDMYAYNIVELSHKKDAITIDGISALKKYFEGYVACHLLTTSNWINISINNMFASDNLHPDERALISKISAYYISDPKVPIIYGGFKLESWIKVSGLDQVIAIQNEYVKVRVTIHLDEATVAPLPLSIFANYNNKIECDVVVFSQSLEKLRTGRLSDIFVDIIGVFTPNRRVKSPITDLAIALALSSSAITIGDVVGWPDTVLQALTQRIRTLVLNVDHVFIVMSKGGGKSNFLSTLPPNYFPFDSDVKGQFLHYVKSKPELLKLIENRDFTNSSILDALLYICINTDDAISEYEVLADEFISSYNITTEAILKDRGMSNYYKAFKSRYVEASRIIDAGQAYGSICGAMLGHINKSNKNLELAKKVHGVHPDTKLIKKLLTFCHSGNEAFYSMTNAIIGVDLVVSNIPILLRRPRLTSPTAQLFLARYYEYNNANLCTICTLHNLYHAMRHIAESAGNAV